MTNKFKFGDKVIYQACLYVVTAAVDDECFLISEGSYDAGIWADASKLTPRHRLGEVRRQITSI